MGKLALTLQQAASPTRLRDHVAWEDVGENVLESWVFEAIHLEYQTADTSLPRRVVVGIEQELLGFIVEERAFWSPGHVVRARRYFAGAEADAIVEAGRIAHDWLCRGYAVFSGASETPTA